MERKIQAYGAWVYVKVDPFKDKTEDGALYVPIGNFEQRTGRVKATVVSVGHGKPTKRGRQPIALKPGDRVMFRGFLKEIHKPNFLDKEYCLVHMDDADLMIEDE